MYLHIKIIILNKNKRNIILYVLLSLSLSFIYVTKYGFLAKRTFFGICILYKTKKKKVF